MFWQRYRNKEDIPVGSSRCEHEPDADVELSQASIVHPVLVRVVLVSLVDSIAWICIFGGYDSHGGARSGRSGVLNEYVKGQRDLVVIGVRIADCLGA